MSPIGIIYVTYWYHYVTLYNRCHVQWLFLFQVLDKKKVKVLVRSDELKRRYKHDPVIISFEWGKGIVYHMISHFYLQRSETRTQKQGQPLPAMEYIQ